MYTSCVYTYTQINLFSPAASYDAAHIQGKSKINKQKQIIKKQKIRNK